MNCIQEAFLSPYSDYFKCSAASGPCTSLQLIYHLVYCRVWWSILNLCSFMFSFAACWKSSLVNFLETLPLKGVLFIPEHVTKLLTIKLIGYILYHLLFQPFSTTVPTCLLPSNSRSFFSPNNKMSTLFTLCSIVNDILVYKIYKLLHSVFIHVLRSVLTFSELGLFFKKKIYYWILFKER